MPRIPGPISVPRARIRRVGPAPVAVDNRASIRLGASADVARAEAFSASVVSEALGDVSNLFLDITERRRMQERTAFASNATMRFFRETNTDFEQSKSLVTESAENFTQGFMERTKGRIDTLLENAPPGSEALFLDQVIPFVTKSHSDAVQFEEAARRRIALRTFNDELDVSKQLLLVNPAVINDVLAVTRQSISLMSPNFAPEDESRLLDETPSDMIEIAVQAFVRDGDFNAARQTMLIQGLNGDKLTPLADLISKAEFDAEKNRLLKIDRLEKDETATRIREQREVSRLRAVSIAKGESIDLISDLAAGDISREQFNQLNIALDQEASVEDNPWIAVNLLKDINEGTATVEDVLAHRGDLSQATTERLLNRADKIAADDESSTVKRFRDFVEAHIGGDRGPFGVRASQSQRRLADGFLEYDQRTDNDEDPETVARDVIARYELSPKDISALALPRFATTNPALSEKLGSDRRFSLDVNATRLRTIQALQAGEITEKIAIEETDLLEQYEELLRSLREARKG